mgnify:CR=1 FL=1
MQYKEQIDLSRIPQHVAIIMDGNGRWIGKRPIISGIKPNDFKSVGVMYFSKLFRSTVAVSKLAE